MGLAAISDECIAATAEPGFPTTLRNAERDFRRTLSDSLHSYGTSSSSKGAIVEFTGTLFDEAMGIVTPSTYINGINSFAHNISSYYNDGGFWAASSYAMTSWNVGAVYSGAWNYDLRYDSAGQTIGDGYQRWATVSGGVAGTASIATSGLMAWQWVASTATKATTVATEVATESTETAIESTSSTVGGTARVCNAAEGMPKPHDHHILYEKGIGKTQQALVSEGSEILEGYGIKHASDEVNRVIAPNIKGQHILANLEEVVNGLREIKAVGGTKEDVVEFLRQMGEKAANRR